jgi:transglutaminase-like putative cysteine protease
LGEARALYRGRDAELFFFLHASRHVPLIEPALLPGLPAFRQSQSLGSVLSSINQWIPERFAYAPGSTSVDTPLRTFIQGGKGVCQDFAHLMLSICRRLGLAARYVSGYIEATDPSAGNAHLIGAVASHAWVEVLLPGNVWWGLDPTNRCAAGERHVVVAMGRDYADISPLRGTFRGAGQQQLEVRVSLDRR